MSSDSARQTVMLLFGGRSAEHEISILSAKFILSALERERFEPLLVGVDREGGWHLDGEERVAAFPSDARAVSVDEAGPLVTLLPKLGGKSRGPPLDTRCAILLI